VNADPTREGENVRARAHGLRSPRFDHEDASRAPVLAELTREFSLHLRQAVSGEQAALERAADAERDRDTALRDLTELRHTLMNVQGERDALRSRLADVVGSEAYRMGRWLVEKPGRPLRALHHRSRKAAPRALPPAPGTAWQHHGLFDPASWAIPQRGRLGFLVSSANVREGRGDFLVAAFLAQSARNRGFGTRLYPAEAWHDAGSECDVVIAMVAEPMFGSYRGGHANGTPIMVAWVRNNVDVWLAECDMASFDHVIASSQGIKQRLSAAGVQVEDPLLPLAAPDHAMGWTSAASDRQGVVVSVNERAGVRPSLQALRASARAPAAPVHVVGAVRQAGALPSWVTPHGPLPVDHVMLLMRRAAVVVDDRQPGNLDVRAVNSRVFEALACGALPVCDAGGGLDELGLQGIPVYRSPDELVALIEFYETHHVEREFLVRRLRRVVQQRHLYRHRLDELLRVTGYSAQAPARRSRSTPTVLVFPDYREGNPYLQFAYSNLSRNRGVHVDYVPLLAAMRFPRGAGAGDVIHMHWTAPILNPARSEGEAEARREGFLRELREALDRGARLVWTVHNRQPHDCGFPEQEEAMRREIANLANLVHVHCEEHAVEVRDRLQVSAEKLRVVGHPTYGSYYGSSISKAEAREKLNIPLGATLFLSFGQVRQYKRHDDLVDFIDSAGRSSLPDSLLAIVGRLGRFEGATALAERLKGHPRVRAELEAVPDDYVATWFSAADVVILASEGSINSGVVALAASFRCPVVAPASGCLKANGVPGQVHTYAVGAGTDAMVSAAHDALNKTDAAWDEAYVPEAFAADMEALVLEAVALTR
jgi:beta-1,4-mannosyltransferase